MIQQPDQFQSRVYVRLPFSDKYLENEAEAKKIRDQLSQLFQKPIIKNDHTGAAANVHPDSSQDHLQ